MGRPLGPAYMRSSHAYKTHASRVGQILVTGGGVGLATTQSLVWISRGTPAQVAFPMAVGRGSLLAALANGRHRNLSSDLRHFLTTPSVDPPLR